MYIVQYLVECQSNRNCQKLYGTAGGCAANIQLYILCWTVLRIQIQLIHNLFVS
jgi:hypothetical protein